MTYDLCYNATPMVDDFLLPKRTYSKTEESSWQKAHSLATMGQEHPLFLQALPHKVLVERVKALIAKGLGDGSIAVRLNRQGVECSRADVHLIRTGTRPPDGRGSFEEVSFVVGRS